MNFRPNVFNNKKKGLKKELHNQNTLVQIFLCIMFKPQNSPLCRPFKALYILKTMTSVFYLMKLSYHKISPSNYWAVRTRRAQGQIPIQYFEGQIKLMCPPSILGYTLTRFLPAQYSIPSYGLSINYDLIFR